MLPIHGFIAMQIQMRLKVRRGQKKKSSKFRTEAKLTEKHCEELKVFNHPGEEVPVDVLDGVLLHLVQEPGQQLGLLARVAVVDARLLLFKVQDGGKLGDAVPLGKGGVVGLDELDADGVGVVVDLLELLDGLVAGLAVGGVCREMVNAPEGLNKVILSKIKRFDCKTNQVSSKQLASS